MASYSWTCFGREELPLRQPRNSIQGGRGGTGRARMERPLAIANGEIATASGPERQDAQAGGVKRTIMTSLTTSIGRPSARMHIERPRHAFLPTRSA